MNFDNAAGTILTAVHQFITMGRMPSSSEAAALGATVVGVTLDPESEQQQTAICQGIGFVTQDGGYSAAARDQARNAIKRLQALAQGEPRT